MALIDPSDATTVQLLAVRADNAPEMKLKLEQALAAVSDTLRIWDFSLVGTGAAPRFLALVTIATAAGEQGGSTPNVDPTTVAVAVATAIDPIELSEQIAAELIALGNGATWWKAVSGGGGFGPHWMSAAIYTPGDPP